MHWQFDARTAILILAGLAALVGAMLWALRRSQPASCRDVLEWWVLGLLTYAAGLALAGLEGWLWVGWTSVVSDALLAAGLACSTVSLRRFFGLPERRRRLFALAAIAPGAALLCVFAWRDLSLHRAVAAAIFALVCAVSARTVFRRGARPSRGQVALGSLYALAMALLVMQVLSVLVWQIPAPNLLAATPMSLVVIAASGLLPAAATVAFLVVCSERGQEELERSARLDYLTGIFNRGAIEELAARQIASTLRHGLPLALMVVDIDHFKRINDDLGHAAGDQALALTVRMIQGFLRTEDLIGRLGGEEFVVLLPDTDVVQARHAAERMRAAVEASPVSFFGIERYLTVSIGVAEYRAEDGSFGPLLRRADRALYAAKHGGRNRVVVDMLEADPLAIG